MPSPNAPKSISFEHTVSPKVGACNINDVMVQKSALDINKHANLRSLGEASFFLYAYCSGVANPKHRHDQGSCYTQRMV